MMPTYLIIYLVIGSLISIATMLNKDIWEFLIEFGFIGFMIQFVMTVVFFPFVVVVAVKEFILK